VKAAPRGFGLVVSLMLHGVLGALLLLWPTAEKFLLGEAEPEGLAIIYEAASEAEGEAMPPLPPVIAHAPPIPDTPALPSSVMVPPPPPPVPTASALAVAPPPPAPPALPPVALAEAILPAPPPTALTAPEAAMQQMAETAAPAPLPEPPRQAIQASPERRPPQRQTSPQPVRLNAALQGTESFTLEGHTVPPEALDSTRNRRPTYPEASRRRGEQGVVRLELFVDQVGRITEVRVVESSGFAALDTAALEAVRDWRFRPAQRAGLPVVARIIHPVHFRLETARR
jgi:protein TonB